MAGKHFTGEAEPEAASRALVGVLLVDGKGRILSANDESGRMLGYDPEDLCGRSIGSLNLPEVTEQSGSSPAGNGAGPGGAMRSVLLHADGSEFPVQIQVGMITIGGENCTVWTLGPVDPVLEEEGWLRQVVDAMPGVFYVMDEEGRLVYWNRMVEEFYGYTPEELKNMFVVEFILPEERKRMIEEVQQVMGGEIIKGAPHTHVLKDGKTVPHLATGGILTINGRSYLTGLAVDISELVAAREELERKLEENDELKRKLEAENLYLQSEIGLTGDHRSIVGKSRAIHEVLLQIEQVAPTDSAVLILGETGTGKELVARRIHELSSRAAHPMIKVNCSALPASLIEAELFGREKAHIPELSPGSPADSNWPTDRRSFSMRLESCLWNCRPNSSECWKAASSNAWAARGHGRWICGSLPPRTGISGRLFALGISEAICIIGWRFFPCVCRLFGIVRRMSLSSSGISLTCWPLAWEGASHLCPGPPWKN